MKKILLSLFSFLIFLIGCTQKINNNILLVAKGHMPAVAKDKWNSLHIVYGTGDSIMYVSSQDGLSYSSPALISVLPGLLASATRGPQIAAVSNGLIITAGNKMGDIYSYRKDGNGKWSKAKKINEIDEISKEGLMALSADGSDVYSVWLGVNDPRGQNIYGVGSEDGGKTWDKNIIVYASPSGTVCECCKPSVAVAGKNVYVMFRNFLNGNRDMYLIKSADGGKSFGSAQKLGNGSWELDGCPMDGGNLVLNHSETPETVWRREAKIYTAQPGKQEIEIGTGRSCTIESINNKNVYAWTEKGNVIVMKTGGIKLSMGKGSLPLLKALNNEKIICIWENENKIHASAIGL